MWVIKSRSFISAVFVMSDLLCSLFLKSYFTCRSDKKAAEHHTKNISNVCPNDFSSFLTKLLDIPQFLVENHGSISVKHFTCASFSRILSWIQKNLISSKFIYSRQDTKWYQNQPRRHDMCCCNACWRIKMNIKHFLYFSISYINYVLRVFEIQTVY